MKRGAVKHTLTLAWAIRRIIRASRLERRDPFEELERFLATTSHSVARRIFEGKVIDVDRKTSEGFTPGQVTILGHQTRAAECRINVSGRRCQRKLG